MMRRKHLATCLQPARVLGALLAFMLFLSGCAPSASAPSAPAGPQAQAVKPSAPPAAKPPQSPELAASDLDADATVSVAPAPPLPEKIPAILLSDQPVQPSPLLAGVTKLPYVPPSPDTKPEFEFAPAAAKVSSAGPSPAAPSLVLAPMPAPLMTFDAMDFNTNGAGHPPDPNGDVGLTYYMQAVNTSIGIYNKQTGANAASFTFNSFWSGAGTGTACDTANMGDPVVLYDSLTDHWIFMDFAWTDLKNGPYFFCFGVSQTSDPTGAYWRYAIRADDASHPWLPDYPKGGIWPDSLYFSANMFDCLNSGCSSSTYQEARAYAFNLQKMEAGLPLAPTDLQAADTNSSFFTLLPSNVRGSQLPPANTPNYFVSEDTVNYFWDVFKFHADFANPMNTSVSGPILVSQATYTLAASSVAEPSPGNNADTLADRAMFLNQYSRINSSESLWVQHTVGTASTSTPTGIQWAQIDVSASSVITTPVQQQIFNNGSDGSNRFIGSLAVDRKGDVALGYSVSSASVAPDIRYVGRLAGDPLGQMPQSETTLLTGVTRSVQTGNCGAVCIRWGDYSSMSVDPVDGCTFWYTSMYFPVQGNNWVTRIGSFEFPTCSSASSTSLVSHPNPSVFGQTVTFTATVGTSATGAGTPSGVVVFTIGAGLPVTASLSNGVATFITDTLPVGTYPITATYGGDDIFTSSQAVLAADQTVNKASTNTTLLLSPLPPLGSPTLTITATVTTQAPGSGIPTGVVTFMLDGVPAGTAALSPAGVATLTTSLLAPGAHPLDVTYGGSSNFNASLASAQALVPYELFLPLVAH